jgi:hypothetical protein
LLRTFGDDIAAVRAAGENESTVACKAILQEGRENAPILSRCLEQSTDKIAGRNVRK